jgi:hypothetical protein
VWIRDKRIVEDGEPRAVVDTYHAHLHAQAALARTGGEVSGIA